MSKKLDDELAEAILDKGVDDAPGVVKPAPATQVGGHDGGRRPAEPRKKNLGLLLTLLAMVGAVVVLFLLVFQPAAVYATPVDKLVQEPAAFIGRRVRVEGELVPGTLVKRDTPCEYRFIVHKDDARLPVRYPQCVIPDGFRDVPSGGVQVTVEGALAKGGDFEASLVMAKCSSKYDPAKHEMRDGEGAQALPVR
jgi:cytochrome c-type biogenesis protein CcmE